MFHKEKWRRCKFMCISGITISDRCYWMPASWCTATLPPPLPDIMLLDQLAIRANCPSGGESLTLQWYAQIDCHFRRISSAQCHWYKIVGACNYLLRLHSPIQNRCRTQASLILRLCTQKIHPNKTWYWTTQAVQDTNAQTAIIHSGKHFRPSINPLAAASHLWPQTSS